MTRQDLEQLSSAELHDQAVHRATTHVDVGFLWSLIKAIPVAEAASGDLGDADSDIMSVSSLLSDLMHSGEGDVAEQLRPLYLDYLEKHED
jgi:hypothetical protein